MYMKKRVFIFVGLLIALMAWGATIDINTATKAELMTLPLSPQQVQDVYEYRTYLGYFTSLYDLRSIDSIDQKTLLALKPLIMVSHISAQDDVAARRNEIFYLIQRLGSSEGFQEGLSDVWEDYLTTPRNINYMTYGEILNMPNTSPLDAAAILNRRVLGDTLSSYRDMRQSPGISFYGASNLRHYVYYADTKEAPRLYFDYQMKLNTSEYDEAAWDMYNTSMINLHEDLGNGSYDTNSTTPKIYKQSYWGYFDLKNNTPTIMNKFRVRYGRNWKAGVLQFTEKYANPLPQADLLDDDINAKYFASWEKQLDPANRVKVVAGNFRATFAEGLVMENTDFYSSRKTGYGFSKRITGITEDLSRSQEYALRGVAAQWDNPHFNAALFYSNDKKDAVVYDSNGDGVLTDDDDVFGYITMTNRFDNDLLEESETFYNEYTQPGFGRLTHDINIAPRLDALGEQITGGHLQYSPWVGTHIGFTGYEALYDRDITVPQNDSLKALLFNYEEDAAEKYKTINSEIEQLYSTRTGDYDRDYRRVMGFDWRTVLNNTSIQGEYAELSVDGEVFKLGDDPKAMILSSYTQFNNLYFITLYRDYDIGFDNPYARGFSEHEKFDGTALDSYGYAMANPLISDMAINSAQAQAERGVYLETRYRINSYLTLNRTYLDLWERKADSRQSVRFQGELDYRPIFQLSLRGKYKHQTNRYDDQADRAVSKTDETTFSVRANLSNRDRISLEYRYLTVWQPPYPYLTNDPEPGNTIAQGNVLSHGDYIAVDYTHNFNENLKVQGAFMLWDGNGVSHWDWEDIEIDFMGEQGIKYWFHIQDKISDNLYVTLKYKIKQYITNEYEFRAWWNEPEPGMADYFERVEREDHTLRLQLDWKF
jgi:hypothetical protein